MKKKLPLLVLMLQASLSFSVSANEAAVPAVSLTPEQTQHEEELKRIRLQTQLIEAKHAQAKLLKDCMDMGIECSVGGEMGMAPPMPDPFLDEPNDQPFQMFPGTPPEQAMTYLPTPEMEQDFAPSMGGKTPSLSAIQNNSAQLSFGEDARWYNVGDKAGQWKVIYISTTKVRLKHAQNDSVKTLLMTW